jgi:MFS family permease
LGYALLVPDSEVNVYYSFVCLTAPVSGVVISGCVYTHIGGYNQPKAYALTASLGFFAVIFCLPIPFLTSKYFTYALIWLVFFFGATILAPLVALMLNSVDQEKRTTANSMATLSYNLFGYLPAPFIYGATSDLFSENHS